MTPQQRALYLRIEEKKNQLSASLQVAFDQNMPQVAHRLWTEMYKLGMTQKRLTGSINQEQFEEAVLNFDQRLKEVLSYLKR